MNEHPLSQLTRRAVLVGGAAGGLSVGLATVASSMGCDKTPKAFSCSDTTTLSSTDARVRTSLAYVDSSVEVGKSCSSCQQFVPGPPDACGSCKVLKGSVHPAGYCRSYLAKPPT
ncbi:MAG TPA: high-potential iron-sulfur protein [Polyangiaceae bacterium]